MPVVDANVLVALTFPQHEHHAVAAKALATDGIIVVRGALQEFAQTVRRLENSAGRDGNGLAREAVARVVALEGFREAPFVDLEHVAALYATENSLSFADAWSLAAALHMREPLLTYDKKLMAAYKKRH